MSTESPRSLSQRIPSSCNEATNKQVTELVLMKTNKKGLYKKHTPEKKDHSCLMNLKFSNTRLYFLTGISLFDAIQS